MPTYRYKCMHCEYTHDALYPMSTPKVIDCPECKEEDVFVKQIVPVNFVVRGANASNGYQTAPTNEQMGLPPQRDLHKRLDSEFWAQNVKKGGLVNDAEKEAILEEKKQEKEIKRERDKKIDYLSGKYPKEADKLKKAMKRAKEKTPEQRAASAEKRKKRGDLGTRRPIEVVK